MAKEPFDRARASAMARQVGIDFGASLTVALAYIGDRLGVFKLMADGEPMTSRQIAERTGLNETLYPRMGFNHGRGRLYGVPAN